MRGCYVARAPVLSVPRSEITLCVCVKSLVFFRDMTRKFVIYRFFNVYSFLLLLLLLPRLYLFFFFLLLFSSTIYIYIFCLLLRLIRPIFRGKSLIIIVIIDIIQYSITLLKIICSITFVTSLASTTINSTHLIVYIRFYIYLFSFLLFQ